MKSPRNLSGQLLADRLACLGYQILHQTGSHLICRTQEKGEHTEATPRHKPMKIGTLSSILKRIAAHHECSVDELLGLLGL